MKTKYTLEKQRPKLRVLTVISILSILTGILLIILDLKQWSLITVATVLISEKLRQSIMKNILYQSMKGKEL